MQTMVDSFLSLVSFDSPSFEEDRLALYLEHKLLSLGLSTQYDEAGNLYAYLPGSGPTVLLNAHMDTVELARGAKPVIEHGIIRTDGTTALGADDKAALAAILSVLETIREKGLEHPNLVVLFTTAEEQGLLGAKKIDPSLLAGVDYAFTLDASQDVGLAITAAPSYDRIEAIFTGKGAHAGFKPETGISAIQMGSDAVSAMHLLRIDEETTANIGSFIAEGAKNIVCDKATLVFEARSLSNEKLEKQVSSMKETLEASAAKHGGAVQIIHDRLYDAYRHHPEAPVLQVFRKACETLSLPLREEPTLGGSDANILNVLGIPALVCSIGYEEAHTKGEYISIEQLEKLYLLTMELATL
ncbi:MAG: M20/M25/M40 family metallo-hydrolase [Spirochaetia bacterium]|nr:M20/M25/M40 family metallo-hydrolase [Spirochaetia bacterium]